MNLDQYLRIDQSASLLGIKESDMLSRLQTPPPVTPPDQPLPPVGNTHKSPIETLILLLENIHQTHLPTAIISLVSILFLVATKWAKSSSVFLKNESLKVLNLVPEILVLVTLSTLFSAIFRWDLIGVEILRDVKVSLFIFINSGDHSLRLLTPS
jgi:MFS superfamily sulfate permease-like transporter